MVCLFLLMTLLNAVGVKCQLQKTDEFLGVCDQPWLPVYSHDYRGIAKLGTLSSLQKHVLSGHMVRVQFSVKEYLITHDLDDFTFRGSHVCGSFGYIFSDNGTHIETDPDWLPTLVCTNGELSRINYTSANWTTEVGQIDVELDGEIWWFTKPIQSSREPIFSQFIDGSTSSGSLPKLLRYAKWAELRANMRDRGFAFSLQNQKIFNNEVLSAQSVNHYSLRYTKNSVKFNEDPYYTWLASWSTNGRRDVSRWFITNSTQYKHNNDFVSLDWFGDECWRRVYSTDEDGFPVYGSLEELMAMIKLGHRVRVQLDGYNLKANSVRVLKGVVIAQSIEEFGRKGNYSAYDATFLDTRVQIIFRVIHSTGRVKSYAYYLDTFAPVNGVSNEVSGKLAVDWLVDTRPWKKCNVGVVSVVIHVPASAMVSLVVSVKSSFGKKFTFIVMFSVSIVASTVVSIVVRDKFGVMASDVVLRTDASGTVTFGAQTDLEEAISMGASVRLNIEQDELAGKFFTEADNVRYSVDHAQVFAQALRHVSDQKLQTLDEYALQSEPFRWSLMVSSIGNVAMHARRFQTRTHLYDSISPATNVTWFINS
ncbi:hypothetical protein Btru_066794 [Bulinus truncatus]|nr:hypothetical protein Btru_066794 [Bulinus truncatus]